MPRSRSARPAAAAPPPAWRADDPDRATPSPAPGGPLVLLERRPRPSVPVRRNPAAKGPVRRLRGPQAPDAAQAAAMRRAMKGRRGVRRGAHPWFVRDCRAADAWADEVDLETAPDAAVAARFALPPLGDPRDPDAPLQGRPRAGRRPRRLRPWRRVWAAQAAAAATQGDGAGERPSG